VVLAVAFLSQVVSFRVVAAPGRAQLPAEVLHLWLGHQQRALHLLLVVARPVDHRHLALFLSRHRALRPGARRQAALDRLVARLVCHELCLAQMAELLRPAQMASWHPAARPVGHEACPVQMEEPLRLLQVASWHRTARPGAHGASRPVQMAELLRLLQAAS